MLLVPVLAFLSITLLILGVGFSILRGRSRTVKKLMVNTYAGALTQVRDQTVKLRPVRAGSSANEVVIGTDVVNKGEPIQLDYRLEKAGDAWQIYDFNVLGLWATDSFRSPFARDLSGGGVDALIARWSEKNKSISGSKN